MTVTLRQYQADLVAAARAEFARGHRRVLAVLPTGGGKGRVLAHLGASVAACGKRVTIMAHRAQLVKQICDNLDDEGVPHTRIQPGWPMLDLPVAVGMVQTIVRRLGKLPIPDLSLTDEAHHAIAPQYRRIAEAWPGAREMGVTATPVGAGGRGLDAAYDAMVVGPSTAELIDAKHLADYEYYLPSPDFSMEGVPMERGDYQPAAALRMVTASKIVGDAVAHFQKHLAKRTAITFCMGVQHAKDVAEQFREAGIRSAHIDGSMPDDEREALFAGLASGGLDNLTAADVVSEGVDIPSVSGIIMLRPTGSLGLLLQQVGRGLRLKPDGSRAVILDHVGNARRHGFPADPRKWVLTGKVTVAAPTLAECPKCYRAFAAADARQTALATCTRPGICPMHTARVIAAPALPIIVTPGQLERALNPWAWAGGINPLTARGLELKALIAAAPSEQELKMIARALGYHHRWVGHIMRDRAERAA